MDLDQDKKADFIIRYISGRLTPEEKRKMGNWIRESKDNSDFFNRILRQYILIHASKKEKLLMPSQDAWNNIRNSMYSGRRIKINWFASLTAVAALIALLLMFRPLGQSSKHPGKLNAQIITVSRQAIFERYAGVPLNPFIPDGNYIKENMPVRFKINSAAGERDSVQVVAPVYNNVFIPRGSFYSMCLSDGTEVWINAETRFKFPVFFEGKQRRVTLLAGEAYFKVAHDPSVPFIVETPTALVKVYGTEFNINLYDPRAASVTLVKGSVGISVPGKNLERIMAPGENAVISGARLQIKNTDTYTATAWKNGDIVFENERLEDILVRLSRIYDIEVHYNNNTAKEFRYYADVKKYPDLQKLLDMFESSSGVKFLLNDHHLSVDIK